KPMLHRLEQPLLPQRLLQRRGLRFRPVGRCDLDRAIRILGDGVWHQPNGEANEPGLDGWKIKATKLNDGVPIEMISLSLTSDGGKFSIPVPESGTYRVTETQKDGWTQTAPTPDSFFDVFVDVTDSVVNRDNTEEEGRELLFGNKENPPTDNGGGSGGDEDDGGGGSNNDNNNDNGGGANGPIGGISFGFGGGEGGDNGSGTVLGAETTKEEQIAALKAQIEELRNRLKELLKGKIDELKKQLIDTIRQRIAEIQEKIKELRNTTAI
ncbi:MAG: hypothetical protein AAB795_04385, partial [Patescibacteria group bacterium]